MSLNNQLLNLGYAQSYIDLINDPKHKGDRLTPENLILMESLVGKTVNVTNVYKNKTVTKTVKITSFHPGVSSSAISSDGVVISSFDTHVISKFKNNEFIFDQKDRMDNETISE